MRAQVILDGLTVTQLRAVLATCSRERDAWAVGSWQPRVKCDGPDMFQVRTDPVAPGVAERIIHAAWTVD